LASDLSLTEALIREHSEPESFRRGQEYYRDGAVRWITRCGDAIEAEVEGSALRPYQVSVTFDTAGVTSAACTCPYDWGGWCKHVVATLLMCLHEPQAIEEREPLETRLAGLSAEQLREVLLRIADTDSQTAAVIERHLEFLAPARPEASDEVAATNKDGRTDGRAVRKAVRGVLHSLDRMRASEAYWHVGSVVDEVREVLWQARERLDAGDGDGALAVLEAVTEAYLADWEWLDDSDGEASGFFEDLACAWMEALLTADLTPAEGNAWAAKLESWADDLEKYGLSETLSIASLAASRRWDDPALQTVLQGMLPYHTSGLADLVAEHRELTAARLKVLERQGRLEEYLRLARVTGQTEAYATMLVRLGRVKEAVDYGREHLETAVGALRLAQGLRERGALNEALEMAEHGTLLPGPRAGLATWLCDLARGMGQTETALRASVLAFRERPELGAYLSARELAGAGWNSLRDQLLADLRAAPAPCPAGHVEVFLHEGFIADAIAAVKGAWDYRLVDRVAKAAIEAHPDWVIDTCRKQAEAIMNAARAELYDAAVRWLEHAREAYRVAGREDDWRVYLQGLVVRHTRKHKLRPMLEALGS
jgi:uncharacterized Zn finger protein